MLKLNLRELYNLRDDKVYELDDAEVIVEDNPFLRALKNLNGYVAFYLDAADSLVIEYDFEGFMVCPDSRTLEDVELPFKYEASELAVDDESKDGFLIYDGETIEKLLISIVWPDVPIKVEKSEKQEYYSGDGWAVMSEEDFLKSQNEVIDPRLEKLMEFKEE